MQPTRVVRACGALCRQHSRRSSSSAGFRVGRWGNVPPRAPCHAPLPHACIASASENSIQPNKAGSHSSHDAIHLQQHNREHAGGRRGGVGHPRRGKAWRPASGPAPPRAVACPENSSSRLLSRVPRQLCTCSETLAWLFLGWLGWRGLGRQHRWVRQPAPRGVASAWFSKRGTSTAHPPHDVPCASQATARKRGGQHIATAPRSA